MAWQHYPETWGLRIVNRNGELHVIKLKSLHMLQKDKLAKFIRTHYPIRVSEKPFCTKGVNYGMVKFSTNILSINAENQLLFEIPLKSVAECKTGMNEVTLEFCKEALPKDGNVGLAEIRFHTPSGADISELKKLVLRKGGADVPDYLAKIPYVRCLTSRSRFDITFYRSYLHLYGKKCTARIDTNKISNIFMLPQDDGNNFVAFSTRTPVYLEKTSYSFFIFILDERSSRKYPIDLPSVHRAGSPLKNSKIDRKNRATKFASVLHQLTGGDVRLHLPLNSASARTGFHFDGTIWEVIFPLESGFFLVSQRPAFIKKEDIDWIEFATNAEFFELKFYMKSDTDSERVCSDVKIDDLPIILNFVRRLKIRCKCTGSKTRATRKISWSRVRRIVSSDSESENGDDESGAHSDGSFIVPDSDGEPSVSDDDPFVVDSSEETSDILEEYESGSTRTTSSSDEGESCERRKSILSRRRSKGRCSVKPGLKRKIKCPSMQGKQRKRRCSAKQRRKLPRRISVRSNNSSLGLPNRPAKNVKSKRIARTGNPADKREKHSVNTNISNTSRYLRKLRLRLRRSVVSRTSRSDSSKLENTCSSVVSPQGSVPILKTLKMKRINESRRILCSDSSDSSSEITDCETTAKSCRVSLSQYQDTIGSEQSEQSGLPQPGPSHVTVITKTKNLRVNKVHLNSAGTATSPYKNAEKQRSVSVDSHSHDTSVLSAPGKVGSSINGARGPPEKYLSPGPDQGACRKQKNTINSVSTSAVNTPKVMTHRSCSKNSLNRAVPKHRGSSEARPSLEPQKSMSPRRSSLGSAVTANQMDDKRRYSLNSNVSRQSGLELSQKGGPDKLVLSHDAPNMRQMRRSSAKSSGRANTDSAKQETQALIATLFGTSDVKEQDRNSCEKSVIAHKTTHYAIAKSGVTNSIIQTSETGNKVANKVIEGSGNGFTKKKVSSSCNTNICIDKCHGRRERKDQKERLRCRNQHKEDLKKYLERKFQGDGSLYERSGIYPPGEHWLSERDIIRHITFADWLYSPYEGEIGENADNAHPFTVSEYDDASISSSHLKKMTISAGGGGSLSGTDSVTNRSEPELNSVLPHMRSPIKNVVAEWISRLSNLGSETASVSASTTAGTTQGCGESVARIVKKHRNFRLGESEAHFYSLENAACDNITRTAEPAVKRPLDCNPLTVCTESQTILGQNNQTQYVDSEHDVKYVLIDTMHVETNYKRSSNGETLLRSPTLPKQKENNTSPADVKYVLIDTMEVVKNNSSKVTVPAKNSKISESNTNSTARNNLCILKPTDEKKLLPEMPKLQKCIEGGTSPTRVEVSSKEKNVSTTEEAIAGSSRSRSTLVASPKVEQVVTFLQTSDMCRGFRGLNTGIPKGSLAAENNSKVNIEVAAKPIPSSLVSVKVEDGTRTIVTSDPRPENVPPVTGLYSGHNKSRALLSPAPLTVTITNSESYVIASGLGSLNQKQPSDNFGDMKARQVSSASVKEEKDTSCPQGNRADSSVKWDQSAHKRKPKQGIKAVEIKSEAKITQFVHNRFGRIYFPRVLKLKKIRKVAGRDERGRLVFYPNGPCLSKPYHVCPKCRRLGHTNRQCPNPRYIEEENRGSQAGNAKTTQDTGFNPITYNVEHCWKDGNGQQVSMPWQNGFVQVSIPWQNDFAQVRGYPSYQPF